MNPLKYVTTAAILATFVGTGYADGPLLTPVRFQVPNTVPMDDIMAPEAPPPAPAIAPLPDNPAIIGYGSSIGGPVSHSVGSMPLFGCVTVKDKHNIHPCAVPKVIAVPDPCNRPKKACLLSRLFKCDKGGGCGQQTCGCGQPISTCGCNAAPACGCDPCAKPVVFIQICVPPCGCPEIKENWCGNIKYDYGEYEVEISVKDGFILVDYDD